MQWELSLLKRHLRNQPCSVRRPRRDLARSTCYRLQSTVHRQPLPLSPQSDTSRSQCRSRGETALFFLFQFIRNVIKALRCFLFVLLINQFRFGFREIQVETDPQIDQRG